MINLIQAYSVSLKHLLRGEPGIYYEDLYPLVNFLPKYASSSSMGHITPETTRTSSTIGFATGEKVAGMLDRRVPHIADKNGTLPLWWISPDTKLPPVRKPNKLRRFDPESALPRVEAEIPLRPSKNPPQDDFFDFFPIFIPFRWIAKALSSRVRKRIEDDGDERTLSGKRRLPSQVESNVPLEVWYVLRPKRAA
jgi:ion channel-forming bestrophin family protein